VAEGIQHKLILKLLDFNFSVEYKKGKENTAADALSRKFSQLCAISTATPNWMLEVVNTYNADDHTKEMVQKFLITPPDNNFNYSFIAGVL
jgi:hypothetical protein